VLLFGNRLTSVPVSGIEPGSERWENLTSLDLSNNRLSSLPAALGDIASLRVLDLRFNRLQSLPPEIGKLKVGILIPHFAAAAANTNARTHRSCESCA
jgi:Leucine-rich repeat (LRR) protein